MKAAFGWDPSEDFKDLVVVVDAGAAIYLVAFTIAGTQLTCWFHRKQAISTRQASQPANNLASEQASEQANKQGGKQGSY